MSSSKERFFAKNTLAVLLIAMTGRRVIVETKNESAISGKLLHSDGYGNLFLSKAKMTTITGRKIQFDEVLVKVTVVSKYTEPSER